MTSTLSPGDDPRWGHPLGGYTTFGGEPPEMGGTPMNQKKRPGQQMPGAPMRQGSSSGAVTTGFGLKNSPFGQFGGFHPNTVGVMRKNFGL